MFKKPGVRIGCPRDMGNASEWIDGSERYDDGGDAEGPVGMRAPGSDTLFTRGLTAAEPAGESRWLMVRGDGQTESVPAREGRGTGSGIGRLADGGALAMRRRRGRAARIRAPQARR